MKYFFLAVLCYLTHSAVAQSDDFLLEINKKLNLTAFSYSVDSFELRFYQKNSIKYIKGLPFEKIVVLKKEKNQWKVFRCNWGKKDTIMIQVYAKNWNDFEKDIGDLNLVNLFNEYENARNLAIVSSDGEQIYLEGCMNGKPFSKSFHKNLKAVCFHNTPKADYEKALKIVKELNKIIALFNLLE